MKASEIKAFQAMQVLSDLSAAEKETVMAISRRVNFRHGEVIMREGEIGDSMYFFIEGEVKVSKELTLKVGRGAFSQAEKSMLSLKPGPSGLFGDMAMFGDEPRSATITASSDCVLFAISRESFTELCVKEPGLGVKLLHRIALVLCERLRKSNSDVLKLSTALSLALSK